MFYKIVLQIFVLSLKTWLDTKLKVSVKIQFYFRNDLQP